ncbi:cytochrome P450 monooxygenase [Roridomyces roridus]|uniref:Cytochrome P450 monooxygenase n=1 Tax=Roridomyces roridus TaxID=1738132 RepID=A0AAD7CMT7_9AGAR|nr:cytochrome P450 monooxygenase [Roridomyces roridus]
MSYTVVLVPIASAAFLWLLRGRNTSTAPGPPKLPLIGNLFDIPRSREVLAYNAMADKYGPIVNLSVLGKNIFVISSARILLELFGQRGTNYSGRPHSSMLHDLMDLKWIFAFKSYGSSWRDNRKMFHTQFQESVLPDLRPLQLKSTHAMLRTVLASPNMDDFFTHLHFHVGSCLMEITYGPDTAPRTARLIGMADDVITAWSKVAVPGSYIVDVLPIFRFLPERLIPGGGFKKEARICKAKAVEARDAPFERVQAEMAAGTAPTSFVSNLLNAFGTDADHEMIKTCAGTVYFAGTEALSVCLQAFVMAMVAFPDVQKKAQAELDQVVGTDRLLDFGDQNVLPYCNAIVQEVLRWNPPAPLASPHLSVNPDTCEGYDIPANSLVVPNLWKILHDPEIFPNPAQFRPERFLASEYVGGKLPREVLETYEIVFGPGRRICPGRYFVPAQLFISMASILSVFDLSPVLGADGKKEKVEANFTYGLANHPTPFKVSVTPRRANVQELLDAAE